MIDFGDWQVGSAGRLDGDDPCRQLDDRSCVRVDGLLEGAAVAGRSSRDRGGVCGTDRPPAITLVVAVWLAAGYWPLTPEVQLLVGRTVFVVGALSVTLAAAAIASQSVDVCGAMFAPALPVSSLTRNVAWALIAVLGSLVVLNGIGLSITVTRVVSLRVPHALEYRHAPVAGFGQAEARTAIALVLSVRR